MGRACTINASPDGGVDVMKGRYVVGRAADLPPSSRQVVTVEGHEIGIFNLDGSYYALLNRCPHRSGPLCHGRLRPLIISTDVGQVSYEREGEVLKCPWHQWEFDLRTGEALYDPRLRVRTYEVAQEGDEVVLYL
jgi:3-phenylpropionate/trans-cinnamate dioxygenase ferredoxin subunit